MNARKLQPTSCIECLMAWLLYGDGAVCLLCRRKVYWRGGRSGGEDDG